MRQGNHYTEDHYPELLDHGPHDPFRNQEFCRDYEEWLGTLEEDDEWDGVWYNGAAAPQEALA